MKVAFFPGCMVDMLYPEDAVSRQAISAFEQHFQKAMDIQ